MNFFRSVFTLPPVEKRPPKSFWLNQYAVVGYDPKSNESYILYKSFLMAFWIFMSATALYALPLLLRNTPWAGFHVFPDYYHDLPARPVDYYKYGFPRTVSLPLIGITCVYAVLLSWITRAQHNWNFSGTRPVYLRNMARIKKKGFGFTRMAALHLVFPAVLAIAFYCIWSVPEFWNSYILLKYIHDFSVQTLENFLIIMLFYLVTLPVCAETFFVFIFLLLFEKAFSPTTTLEPLFRKGKNFYKEIEK